MRAMAKDDLVKDEHLIPIGACDLYVPFLLRLIPSHLVNAGVEADVV